MSEREFFNMWLRLTVALKESEKGRLIDAIAESTIYGKTTALPGKEASFLPVFSASIKEKQPKERAV